MKGKSKVFAGRVIFDHVQKTAGQAVNAWLSKMLGPGCVTPNLIGSHRDLIRRYGGEYSVISAHIDFQGTGLDPRYQYLTCLREPIDRAISWLFFLLNNHDANMLPGLWEQAERFVAGLGEPCDDFCAEIERSFDPSFIKDIRNPYVEHFSAIAGTMSRTDDEKIAAALSSVEQYDVYGFYEDLPAFLSDVSTLIGLPAPRHIEKVNATRARPGIGQITPMQRKQLEMLNALDIEFYSLLRSRWQRERANRTIVAAPDVARWLPYEPATNRAFSTPEFSLLSATLEGGDTYLHGQIMRFNVVFSINIDVAELGVGIEITDGDGRIAFGCSNSFLKRPLVDLKRGTYCARYYLGADLPEGQYVAGLAFCDNRDRRNNELAYHKKLISFNVVMPRVMPSVGYMSLPADFDCHRTGDAVSAEIHDAAGCLYSDAVADQLAAGETFELPVQLTNASTQTWVSSMLNPIYLSYRWFDYAGCVVASDPKRMPLPVSFVAPGETLTLPMSVAVPDVRGRYRLVATLMFDDKGWFDEYGFTPLSLELTVTDANAPRIYRGADVRLHTQVGHRQMGAMTSSGQEGFLLFGPYVSLPAGYYVVSIEGCCEFPAGSWMDIVCDRGTHVLMRHDVMPGEKGGSIAHFDFELASSANDLEIRVWVSASAKVRIDMLRIERLMGQHEADLMTAVG
ncbi:hypothetical protein [Burkholderia sp. MSMB1589WGS]|uniref:hypothetical protein n=1 Tax=Burkholderia sp. MSMB1589WGS TaxID=1636425 RepID=UPI0007B9806A|nr:hypothetical protein [Burkholderia sp. MSMB1589WGS]